MKTEWIGWKNLKCRCMAKYDEVSSIACHNLRSLVQDVTKLLWIVFGILVTLKLVILGRLSRLLWHSVFIYKFDVVKNQMLDSVQASALQVSGWFEPVDGVLRYFQVFKKKKKIILSGLPPALMWLQYCHIKVSAQKIQVCSTYLTSRGRKEVRLVRERLFSCYNTTNNWD